MCKLVAIVLSRIMDSVLVVPDCAVFVKNQRSRHRGLPMTSARIVVRLLYLQKDPPQARKATLDAPTIYSRMNRVGATLVTAAKKEAEALLLISRQSMRYNQAGKENMKANESRG